MLNYIKDHGPVDSRQILVACAESVSILTAVRLYNYRRNFFGWSESKLEKDRQVRTGKKTKINNVLAHLKFTGKIKKVGHTGKFPIWDVV